MITEDLFALHCAGQTALIRAAENGDESLVKQLIAARANPDAKDVINRACALVSHFQSAPHFPRLALHCPE